MHGRIVVSDFALQFVDTPQFQRLRELKQLGTTYYVFPGASHNRFEHSVGVYHLAGILANLIRIKQPELKVTQRMVDLVSVAGLCHDLGHGPFSHVFDSEFIPRAKGPGCNYEHEDMSEMMLKYLVEDNNIELDEGELEFILKCIRGMDPDVAEGSAECVFGCELYPRFLFDIVANKRNGIDVDKFDYLARDAASANVKSMFDCARLVGSCVAIDGEIVYNFKDMFNVYTMFHTRYALFKTEYTHRAAKAIEYMICDALLEANRAWKGKLADAIDSAKDFIKLDDTLLRRIETSDEPELEKARSIIDNLRRRMLYRYADSELLASHLCTAVRGKSSKRISAGDIADFLPQGSKLVENDILVHDCRINMGRPFDKHKNPMDLVHFYRNCEETRWTKVKAERKFTTMMPRHFEERNQGVRPTPRRYRRSRIARASL